MFTAVQSLKPKLELRLMKFRSCYLPAILCSTALLTACGGDEPADQTSNATFPDDSTTTTTTTGITTFTTSTTLVTTSETDSETETETETDTDTETTAGPSCDPDQIDCDGECIDAEDDPLNCGECGVICGDEEVCEQGACTSICDEGFELCGEECVDTQSSAAHCGGCDLACDEGDLCSMGECALDCDEGLLACGESCVDTQTDNAHCGGCDTVCEGLAMCMDGACEITCGMGETVCDDTCVDTDSDIAHCGSCGNVCPQPDGGMSTCESGECDLDCDDGYKPWMNDTACYQCNNDPILADGPVAFWRLGEGQGENTAIDASGNGWHGAYTNVELGEFGIAGDLDTAARFGTPNDTHVDVFNFDDMPTTLFSIEMWILQDDPGGSAQPTAISYAIGGGTQANEFVLRDTTNIVVHVKYIQYTTGLNLADVTWLHLAVTWRSSNGELKVYVDGSESASKANHATGLSMGTGGIVVLGQEQDSYGGGFQTFQRMLGLMDEIAIYDKVLTPAQINAHRNATLCVLP